MNREQVLKHPAYWFEYEQNELFRQVMSYMEREGINRTQLAERLKVSKGYVSQILNGNFNYTLKKWIELCLTIGIVPGEYRKIEDVIKEDADLALSKKVSFEKIIEIQPPIINNFDPKDYKAAKLPHLPDLNKLQLVYINTDQKIKTSEIQYNRA